jgi:uncharacterized protein (TIGR03083 family)
MTSFSGFWAGGDSRSTPATVLAQDGEMDRASYLDSLRGDAADLLAAAAGHLDADVTTCPGWKVERLVGHVGRTYRWTAGWVEDGAAPDVPLPPKGDAVIEWTRTGLAELIDTLEGAGAVPDAGTTVKTWAGDQPPIFWPRRIAIETAVHRWDAQVAAGDGRPLGTDLALDGVDELFEVILPMRGIADLGSENEGKTMHLHATDVGDEPGEGEWLVTLERQRLTVDHMHAKGDVAVRGTASDLLLLLWNRVSADRLEVFGDAGLLDWWRAAVTV